MEKVAIDRVRLSDLRGNPVMLKNHCPSLSLLIFLRHLA
jgi:hypothetical protein